MIPGNGRRRDGQGEERRGHCQALPARRRHQRCERRKLPAGRPPRSAFERLAWRDRRRACGRQRPRKRTMEAPGSGAPRPTSSSAAPDASRTNGPTGLRTATRKAARSAGGLKRSAASRLTAFPQAQPLERKRSSALGQLKIFPHASKANCQDEFKALWCRESSTCLKDIPPRAFVYPFRIQETGRCLPETGR